MKKIFTILMLAMVFGLVSCGEPTEEEKATAEAEAAAMVEEMMGGLEETTEEVVEETELAEHVCDAKCEKSECTGAKCGEAGHECSKPCHAKDAEKHTHAEGEEHVH